MFASTLQILLEPVNLVTALVANVIGIIFGAIPGLSGSMAMALLLPVSFGMKGGREASKAVMGNLKLACIVTHVADARTCVLHPASHTHRQMTDEQLIEAGILPEFIRLSVGIENVDDIIADLAQAIDAI